MLAGLCLLAAMALNVLRFPVPVVARVACLSAKLICKGNEMVIRRNKGNPTGLSGASFVTACNVPDSFRTTERCYPT